VRAAAAQIAGQSFFDLAVAGLGIFIEQRFGSHNHAVDAVAALHRLLVDEGLLDFVHLLSRAQAFEGSDRAILGGAHLGHAGTDGVTVHDDGASAALRHTAAVFGSVELEIVAQDVEQRRFRIYVDNATLAIHLEWNSRQLPPFAMTGEARRRFDCIVVAAIT